METTNALLEIAKVFSESNETVYAVGGYVRNKLLGIKTSLMDDIDICSSVKPADLKKMFEGTEFNVEDKSNGLGVCLISCEGFACEHATFRTENYEKPGQHAPASVNFIEDITEDAKRRDFTCNAVYLNLNTDEFFDPFGGISDIRNKIIRTILSPKIVLNNDGLRILRMVRFAATLGFSVDAETYAVAKKNASRVGLISKALIRKEFDQILVADVFYPELPKTKSGHLRGINMIGNLELWKYILPVMQQLKDSGYETVRNHEKVYEHSLKALQYALPKYRLPALLHDIGMLDGRVVLKETKKIAEIGAEMLPEKIRESELGYSDAQIKWMSDIVKLLGYDEECRLTPTYLRRFILKNRDVIEDVINLKIATLKAITFQIDVRSIDCKLQNEFTYMLKNNIPTQVSELVLNGKDLIELYPFINRINVGYILNELLELCVYKNVDNKKEALVKASKKIVEKLGG